MLTDEQKRLLENQNVAQFTLMDRDAGNMVKELILALHSQGRNTYIRLRDAVPEGMVVSYDIAQGTVDVVKRLAGELGFTSCDEHTLEV